MPNQMKGLLAVGTAAPLGSFFGLLMRLLEHYGSFGVLAVRGSFQIFFFSCALFYTKGFAMFYDIYGMGRLGALAAFCMAGQNFGISVSMLMTTVSNVFFCINTAPAFCIVGDAIFLKESVPWRTWFMVIACLSGVSIILLGSFQSGGSFAGCLVALINPVSWSVYWGIQRHRSKTAPKRVSKELPLVLLCAQVVLMSIGAVGSMFTGNLRKGLEEASNGDTLVIDAIVFFGFGAVFLPSVQFLYSLAPRYISTAQVACVKITETVWGPLWVFIFKGEEPELYTIIGGSFIFCAILAHSLAALLAEAKKPPSNLAASIESEDSLRVGDTVILCVKIEGFAEEGDLEAGSRGVVDQLDEDGKCAVITFEGRDKQLHVNETSFCKFKTSPKDTLGDEVAAQAPEEDVSLERADGTSEMPLRNTIESI